MRPVREITAKEENFRLEPVNGSRIAMIKRDPIQPEPVGSIVLMAFRVTGYEKDCDGSLMASLEHIDSQGNATGWAPKRIGLEASAQIVATSREWKSLFTGELSQ